MTFKQCPFMNVLWVLTCTIRDANAGMITLSLSKTGSSKSVGSCPYWWDIRRLSLGLAVESWGVWKHSSMPRSSIGHVATPPTLFRFQTPSSGSTASELWVFLRWPVPSCLVEWCLGLPGLLVPHNSWVCPLLVRWWWHTRGPPYVLLYRRWGSMWGA